MTTEQANLKRIEITQTPSGEWKQPASWDAWRFNDLIDCPNIEQYKELAPSVERSCPHCEKVEKWNAIEAAVFGGTACEECIDEHDRKQRAPAQARLLEETIAATIPPLYLATDRERLERETSKRQVRKALEWEPEEKGKSLILVGDTRAGKSRTLCLLVQKLLRKGKKVRAFFHGSFYDELVEVMRSERSYRQWKREIAKAQVLVIDDLFSEKLTERGEASLFEVIDERICHYRPTLLSTQVTRKDAMKRFHSEARWEAFFARLKEFFTPIECGKPKQDELSLRK
jgi:DNA replication protein DnaC